MNFTILSCNQAVRRIRDYEPEELVGQSWDLVVPAELLSDPAFPHRRKELLAKGFLEGDDYRLKKKSGETIPVSYSVALIKNDQGRPTGLVGAIRDIAKRKRAEEERAKSEQFLANIFASI